MMDPMMLTEHSGCPVIEGEKWITTFWMREGVTEADPWTAYDPSGVRMMTASDDEEGEVSTPESSETSVDGSSVDDTTTVAVSNETTELQSAIDEL